MWEFSGYEPYHVTYDLFIGDANCINIIVVSLCDSADVRLSQLVFWLNFIKTRLAPQQTFGNTQRLGVLLVIIRSWVQFSTGQLHNNLGQVVHTYIPLLPSSITWYWSNDGDVLWLGR